MKLIHRKSRPQRMWEAVRNAVASVLPGLSPSRGLAEKVPSGKDLMAAVPKDTAVKAGLIAGGLAGATAGSARISAQRRHEQSGAAS